MAKGKALIKVTGALSQFIGKTATTWLTEKGIDQVADNIPFISQMLGKDHAEVMEKLENISNKIDEKTTEILGTVQQGLLSEPMSRIKTYYDLITIEMKENNEDFSSFLKRTATITDKKLHVFAQENYSTVSNEVEIAYNTMCLLLLNNTHNYIDKTISSAKNNSFNDLLKIVDDAMAPYLSMLTMAQAIQMVIKSTNPIIAQGAEIIASRHLISDENKMVDIIEALDTKTGGLYTFKTLYLLRRYAPFRLFASQNNNKVVVNYNSTLKLADADNNNIPNSMFLFWGAPISAVGPNLWLKYDNRESWIVEPNPEDTKTNTNTNFNIHITDFVSVSIGGIQKIRPLARINEVIIGKEFDNWEHRDYLRASNASTAPEHAFYMDICTEETSLNYPWLFCTTCSNLWSPADGTGGCCAGNNGGAHTRTTTAWTYYLAAQKPSLPQKADQNGWFCCKKCRGLVYNSGGVCAKGGVHEVDTSIEFSVSRNEKGDSFQNGWYYCSDCKLLHNGKLGVCSKVGGGTHKDPTNNSDMYYLYKRNDLPTEVRTLGKWRFFNGIQFYMLSNGTVEGVPEQVKIANEETFELIRSAKWVVVNDKLGQIKITWTVKGATKDLDRIDEIILTISPNNDSLTDSNSYVKASRI